MTRETWVYPSDGRPPYLLGTAGSLPTSRATAIMGDLPDFVSPIDGRHYSGRTGLREHNLTHNVTPHADLKGLPYQTTDRAYTTPKEQARERKERIIHMVNKNWK